MPGRKSRANRKSRGKSRKSSRRSRKSKSSQARRNASQGEHISRNNDITFDEVQSIIFDKDDWGKKEAKEWLKEHGYKAGEPDETKTQYRFRQFDPHYGSDWDFAWKTIKSVASKLPIHFNLNYNI